MKEQQIRALIENVRTGKISRRSFIELMVGLGLTAPMAAHVLMHAGVAQAQPRPPTSRPSAAAAGR